MSKKLAEMIKKAKEAGKKTVAIQSHYFQTRGEADSFQIAENLKAEKKGSLIRFSVSLAPKAQARLGNAFAVREFSYTDKEYLPKPKKESLNPTKTLSVKGVKGSKNQAMIMKYTMQEKLPNGHYVAVAEAKGEMADAGFDYIVRHYVKINEINPDELSNLAEIPEDNEVTDEEGGEAEG